MTLRWLLAAVLLLSACESGPQRWAEIRHRHSCTTPDERRSLADAIVRCSAAANPHSDEEGEDLVAQCDLTMKAALCPERRVIVYMHRDRGEIDSRVEVGK